MRVDEGTVTMPDDFGLQARIKRGGREIRNYFSPSKYGTRQEAEIAAREWLKEQATLYPSVGSLPMIDWLFDQEDMDQPIIGVQRAVRSSPDRQRQYVHYTAHYKLNQNSHKQCKGFQAGNILIVDKPIIKHAEYAAKDLRLSYLLCAFRREPFNPHKWDSWRDQDYSLERLQKLRQEVIDYVQEHYPVP